MSDAVSFKDIGNTMIFVGRLEENIARADIICSRLCVVNSRTLQDQGNFKFDMFMDSITLCSRISRGNKHLTYGRVDFVV